MGKLSREKSKMLLVAAVFISLSGFASTNEEHRCYWCGPLADQVHRSRRSQPCNSTSYEETTCDPGYEHCAVIATSPPLTESRVCVKIYQDECYSVYCNSSRHWRVVCPCRGELCNGPLTKRETQAFTILFQKPKRSIFGMKKIRTRRSLIASSNFISARRPRVENNIAIEISTMSSIVNMVTEDQTQSDQPDKTVDIQSTSGSDDITNISEDIETTNLINVETYDVQQKDIETTPQNEETKPMIMSTINNEVTQKDESTVVQNMKPTKETLTAEALQQNSNADKKVTAIITTLQENIPSTHVTTAHSMSTQQPNKNNTASVIQNQFFTSVIGIVLQYFF